MHRCFLYLLKSYLIHRLYKSNILITFANLSGFGDYTFVCLFCLPRSIITTNATGFNLNERYRIRKTSLNFIKKILKYRFCLYWSNVIAQCLLVICPLFSASRQLLLRLDSQLSHGGLDLRLKSRSPYRDGGPRSRSRSDPTDSEGDPSRATSNFSPEPIAKTFSISSSSSGPVSAPCPSICQREMCINLCTFLPLFEFQRQTARLLAYAERKIHRRGKCNGISTICVILYLQLMRMRIV